MPSADQVMVKSVTSRIEQLLDRAHRNKGDDLYDDLFDIGLQVYELEEYFRVTDLPEDEYK